MTTPTTTPTPAFAPYASIPIAVLSITIFRYISRALRTEPATILQNNMVQTTGSAGESIAAGIAFTLPTLLLLGYELPWIKVIAIGVVGGVLGVLFLVPLRRSLIVKEHGNLKYPEGTACAQVLIVGERGGVQAKTVFMGFGLGAVYKFLNAGLHTFLEVPKHAFTKVMAAGTTQLFGEIQAEISPELTGVGYIIGPRIAGYLFAGGLLSFFCLIPAIKLFAGGLTSPIFPATILIRDMNAMQVRANYVYYIGAGAVTAAGLISLARTLPTIWSSLIAGLGDFRGVKTGENVARTDRDLPMGIVMVGTLLCLAAMVLLPQIGINLAGGILALFFPLRHRVESHHGADRQLRESGIGHDGGDAAAHVAHVPRRGLGGHRAPRACAVHRWCGLRRCFDGGRNVAGSQDGLSRWRHAPLSADRFAHRRHGERAAGGRHHPVPERRQDDDRPQELSCRAGVRHRDQRTVRAVQWAHGERGRGRVIASAGCMSRLAMRWPANTSWTMRAPSSMSSIPAWAAGSV